MFLEVLTGRRAGHKLLLRTGQVLKVGASRWADECFESDQQMSREHFHVHFDAAGCILEDLDSKNGTFVNGQRIKRVALRDQDRVVAGATEFVVRMSPEEQQRAAAGPVGITAGIPTQIQTTTAPARLQGDFQVEPCPSGLISCRGQVEQIPAERLAAAVSRELPVYLLIDFRKLGIPFPEGIGPPSYLYDWLGEQVASQMSPHVLAAAEVQPWTQYLREGWGEDGVVCVFSKHDKAQVLGCLRRISRVTPRDRASAGIVGIGWPSVFRPLLSASKTDLVDDLFQIVNAVLIESSKDPKTWELLGGSEIPALLERLGLQRCPVDK